MEVHVTTADDRDRKLPGRPAGLGTEPGPSSRYAARVVGYGGLQADLDAIPPGWHLVAALTAGEGSTVVLLLEREPPPLQAPFERPPLRRRGLGPRATGDSMILCAFCEATARDARPDRCWGCGVVVEPVGEAALEAPGAGDWVPKERFEARLAHAENVSLRAEVERWKAAQREAAEASMRHESQRDEARIALADMTTKLLEHGIKLGHVELPAAGVARLGAECDLLRRARALGWR
jgi:hypothetical protein